MLKKIALVTISALLLTGCMYTTRDVCGKVYDVSHDKGNSGVLIETRNGLISLSSRESIISGIEKGLIVDVVYTDNFELLELYVVDNCDNVD